jgi:hypothetical protein
MPTYLEIYTEAAAKSSATLARRLRSILLMPQLLMSFLAVAMILASGVVGAAVALHLNRACRPAPWPLRLKPHLNANKCASGCRQSNPFLPKRKNITIISSRFIFIMRLNDVAYKR